MRVIVRVTDKLVLVIGEKDPSTLAHFTGKTKFTELYFHQRVREGSSLLRHARRNDPLRILV